MAKRKTYRAKSSPFAQPGWGTPKPPGMTGLAASHYAPPPAPAPQPPPNPYVASTPPIDPAYEAYKISAGRNVALSDANALYEGANIENVYGLGSDTSNPYSRAKLLENNYQRAQRGTQIGLAQQGQLYSGAMQTAQGENTRNYNIGYDQLTRDYTGAKRGVLQGQLQTYASNAIGVDDGKFNSVLRALGGS